MRKMRKTSKPTRQTKHATTLHERTLPKRTNNIQKTNPTIIQIQLLNARINTLKYHKNDKENT